MPKRPHTLIARELEGDLFCTTCKNNWTRGPQSFCVGIEVLPGRWEDVWPEGYMTKTQLNEAGYQTGKKLPKPAALLHWSSKNGKKNGGYLRLYNPEEATPKRKLSDAQRAALDKAQQALHEQWHCSMCSRRLDYIRQGVCYQCDAVQWARDTFKAGEFVILDTETTGLDSRDDPLEIAVIDSEGNTLLDTRVKPRDMDMISPGAYEVHHIGPDDLKDAPTFTEIYPALVEAVRGKTVLVYNEAYDIPLLEETVQHHGLGSSPFGATDCVMEWAAQWIGEYSYHWNSWRWHPLPGGDHTALGDCLATLDVLRHMAKDDLMIYFG